MMHEALLYQRSADDVLQCNACAHRCRIRHEQFGICGVRQNVGGKLYACTYAHPVACQLDPIEKKPFYHFLPGSLSYSVATVGCNFRCCFCQNWRISQLGAGNSASLSEPEVSPEAVVQQAQMQHAQSIAYTYTEPTVFIEYVRDVAACAGAAGFKNLLVTNGFMTPEALAVLYPVIDAANVDLKFFSDAAYQQWCSGRLEPVLDTIRSMKDHGMWVEVTTLVVPGINDHEEELSGIAGFLARIDRDIPWHISRFHPDFQLVDRDATPETKLKQAVAIGHAQGLRYLYAGNVRGWGNNTHCHACGKEVIQREGFEVTRMQLNDGRCPFCQESIPGVYGG